MKVFVVEDSAIVRGRIISLIADNPKIEIAGFSGRPVEAMRLIRELSPDFVILDIRLEGGSGIDLLKIIKSELPETAVLVLTNYPYPQYQNKCRALGAEYFLDKSKDFDKIAEILARQAR